jgi:hypothetical protein
LSDQQFTAAEKAAEAKAELRQRHRVYDRMVRNGRMTRAQADRKIAIMDAIRRDYEQQANPTPT